MTDADALMSHFDFDLTDLEANRRGTLSERQKKKLLPNARPVYWVLALGLVAGSIYVGLQALPDLQAGNLTAVILPGVLLLLALFFVRGAVKPTRFAAQVIAVTGSAQLSQTSGQLGSDGSLYQLRIGEHTFRIDQAGHALLEDGATYTAYWWQGELAPVSIERVA